MPKNTGTTFLLTLNAATLEFYQDVVDYVTKLAGWNYMLVTEHIGDVVNNKHYHMYLQYKQPKYLSVYKLHGAHIEQCFGSAQQNIDYCWARDKKHIELGITAQLIEERGEVRFKGGNYTVGYLRELNDDRELPAIFYNTHKKIQKENRNRMRLSTWRKPVKVYYIQGPSGIGKSNKAEELIRTFYNDKGIEDEDEMYFDELKFTNNFYQGVNQDFPTEVAVFDDFRADRMTPEEFINLIDYRSHNMNVKNGEFKNNYKLIIFTSVQRLDSIYRNVDDFERREQWIRRIELIDMYPPRTIHIGGLPVGIATEFNNFELHSNDNTLLN